MGELVEGVFGEGAQTFWLLAVSFQNMGPVQMG